MECEVANDGVHFDNEDVSEVSETWVIALIGYIIVKFLGTKTLEEVYNG